MKIATDIDGTIGDFVTPFLEFINPKLKRKFQYSDMFSHDLWQVIGGTPDETEEKLDSFHDSPDFQKIRPIKGAVEAVSFLAKKYEIASITARPLNYRAKTLNFMKDYFPTISNVRFSEEYKKSGQFPDRSRKAQFCSEFRPKILFEDHAKTARDCSPYCELVILFNQPWNQNENLPGNVIRSENWEEALKIIR